MHTTMSRLLTVATGTLLLTLAASCSPPADATSAASPPDPRLNGAYRFERNGWIFVHVEGAPDALGFQHGYLLAAEIADLLRVVQAAPRAADEEGLGVLPGRGRAMLWPKIDAEYQQEIDGIVAGAAANGAKADRWDLVALNAIEELPVLLRPLARQEAGQARRRCNRRGAAARSSRPAPTRRTAAS